MKKLTQFSVNYPITVLMLVLSVVLLGYISFRKLSVDLFPDLNNPKIFVEIKAGERPPAEMEKLFVEDIESLAIRQKKVLQVASVTRVGTARITVTYAWNTDMDEAFLDLQKSLTGYNQSSDIDELTITQHDPNAAPILLLAFSHPEISDMDDLRQVAQNYIRNELIRLEGIADVQLLGAEEKRVLISTNNYLLQAFQLTPTDVSNKINSYNRNVSGGSIVEMGRKYVIKGVGEFQSLEDIGRVIVAYQSQTVDAQDQTTDSGERVPVYLKDVAEIEYVNDEPENIVRVNRKRCMALAIYKETKYNTVTASAQLLDALDNIAKALPGYELTIIQNQAEFIDNAIDEVKETALMGIVLAVAVLYLFLRRVGVTFIISIAIPVSVIATFNLMYFNGLTINIMTLGGLALGAGMLVDNAIVVMENIFRNLEDGLSLKEAAVDGTAQVGGAITASTLTTVAVFLPIIYLHGAAGELFKDQAWTVAFSLLSSLVVAVLVLPMLTTRIMKSGLSAIPDKKTIRFPWYRDFLSGVIDKSPLVIAAALLLVMFAVLLIPVVGSEFIPRTSERVFSMEVTCPEGTELNRTDEVVSYIEQSVTDLLDPDIETIYSRVGPSDELTSDEESIFEDENTATIKILLKKNRKLGNRDIILRLGTVVDQIPDAEIELVQEQTVLQSSFGTESAPIVVEIQGEDLALLQELTEKVRQELIAMESLYNVQTSMDVGRPEVDVVVDRARAGMLNVSIDQISQQLRDMLMGRDAGQWESGGELKDIVLKLDDVSVNQIGDVTIKVGEEEVRLDEVAHIEVSHAPKEILRRNQARIGRITADIRSDKPFDHVVQQIEKILDDIPFPPQYRAQITGAEQSRKESFANLKFALILSLILVYMVLASQFESLIHPLTIILTIPLAGVGAILIFFILGRSLNIMAFIGIIMLAGIAVNDSIILVDAIIQLRREGYDRLDAVLEAGQRRIRPILMTSLTTILALLPLTIGFGEGAALRAPMALAVIGGLLTSTILTLVVIPCVYWQFDRIFHQG